MKSGLSAIDAPTTVVADSLGMPREGELHLWYWAEQVGEVAGLNRVERDRYERLIPPDVKQHYLAAHTGLQTILAGYLGITPGEVEWQVGGHGKPFLAPDARLHFNLSHSSGANLLAVGGMQVGVDIERIRPVSSQEGLARRYYTSAEQQELTNLSPQASLERFFAFWTRKEAFVKLWGTGLQGVLSSIDVREVTEAGCQVARADGRDRCWISDVGVPAEYRAAVALEDVPHAVTVYRLAANNG